MNKEIKDRWTAALRSGDYTQGTGSLCLVRDGKASTYCCLGVLCELAVQDGAIPQPVLTLPSPSGTQFRKYGDSNTYDVQTALLPEAVVQWAGLDDQSPNVRTDGGHESLTALNDMAEVHGGLDFNGIADAIEASL